MDYTDSREWRAVLGYEGHYQVSRCAGKVYSLKSKCNLKQVVGRDGYRRVTLWKQGKPKNFLVHRLVAAAFLGPIPVGFQVNHLDGKKENCDASNLEVTTFENNLRHAEATGLRRPIDGAKNMNARLSERDVREIHGCHRKGWTAQTIASQFPVSVRQIQKILAGKAWRQVYSEEMSSDSTGQLSVT